MLQLTIPKREYFDNKTQEFKYVEEQTLVLEHSLISISKWESKWKKPFLDKEKKTYEESIDYVRCMTINTNVDPSVYLGLDQKTFDAISAYIDDSMSATWFSEREKPSGPRQIVTSELIYYWMVAFNIPFECQKWHLNRLLTLVRICEIKNQPAKKMKKSELYSRNRALNAARKRNLGTSG